MSLQQDTYRVQFDHRLHLLHWRLWFCVTDDLLWNSNILSLSVQPSLHTDFITSTDINSENIR